MPCLVAELGDDLVALGQSEARGCFPRSLEQRRRRAQEVESLPVPDAVQVHHPDDRLDGIAVAEIGDEAPGADQADLLRPEGHELDRPGRLGAREVRGDAPEALDSGCVVDRARPPPDGVVVRPDDDPLLTRTRDPRHDVPITLSVHERASHDELRMLPRLDTGTVRPREKGSRRSRDMTGKREPSAERDRTAAVERAGESTFADAPEPVRERPNLALAHARVRVHARTGSPTLALDPELRLLGVVAEEREFLELRLEPELAERCGDGVGRPRGSLCAALAHADLFGESPQ